jgi:PAS domain S-box-containing protein
MNLSRKIVLVIISTFIALIFIVATISDVILLKSYRLFEINTVLKHIQEVYRQFEFRAEQIDVTARDFAQELSDRFQNNSYITSIDHRYFSEASLRIHRIDLAALYGVDGRLITVRYIDCETGTYCKVGQDRLRSLDMFVNSIRDNTAIKLNGTIDIDGEAFMVSVKPLIGTKGTRLGLLVVGCFLDKQELEHVNKMTGNVAYVTGLASDKLTNEEIIAHNELKLSEGFLSRVTGDNSVSGYVHLKDMFGHPTYLLSITEQRSLMDQGKSAIFYIMLVLFISGTVLCTVMLLFIRGTVLKRLASLSSTVGDISRSGDVTSRLTIKGEDELEDLAGSINSMLASLESAETALRESEERYRMLFERAPDAIIILGMDGDEAGRVMAANQAAAEQHGYTIEEMCARTIYDLNTDETNRIAGSIFEQLARGEWITAEFWHKRKDGSRFPIEVHAGPIKMNGRNYVLGFDRDITSRKLAEEADHIYIAHIDQLNRELNLKADELAAANSELESFNYSVSHDLRGPLTRISGYCQLMLEDEADAAPRLRTYVSRINGSSIWLNDMIDTMLNLSRLSRVKMTYAPVDLTGLVDEVLQELFLAEPERKVETVVARDVMANGDPVLLKILVTNLVGNAWKYSSRTMDARIEFGVIEKGPVPVYFVRDNGAGFDMKNAEKLFRVFTRLHDQSQFSGSGIGLATALRIITRHGGRIWAEGEIGAGATFYFTLAADIEDAAIVQPVVQSSYIG